VRKTVRSENIGPENKDSRHWQRHIVPFWASTKAADTSYILLGSLVAVWSTGRIRSAASNDDERLVNDLHSLVIPDGLCIAVAAGPGTAVIICRHGAT